MATMIPRRNVVVIGKTGAGKSTVANKIADYDNFKVSRNVFESATPYVMHTELEYEVKNVKVAMKIVDTVGICYTTSSTTHSISNESVIRQMKDFLINRLPGVNLVLFVFRTGRFTDEEKKSMDYLINIFENEISAISALVITGCDGFDEASLNQIVEEFKYGHRTKEIARFMGKGIYAVGFPDTSKMKPRMKAVIEEEIEEHANMLRDLLMSCETMCLGKEMFKMSLWEKIIS